MKNLSIQKLTTGEHAGHHGIFDGDEMVGYLTDADFQRHAQEHFEGAERGEAENGKSKIENRQSAVLADYGVTEPEELEAILATHRAAKEQGARAAFLAEVLKDGAINAGRAKQLVREGKATAENYILFSDARERVEAAVSAGKLLPRQRAEGLRLALSDPGAFKTFVEDAPVKVNVGQATSLSTAGPDNVQDEFIGLVRQRATERKIPYSLALSEIGRERPELAEQYRRAVTSG